MTQVLVRVLTMKIVQSVEHKIKISVEDVFSEVTMC